MVFVAFLNVIKGIEGVCNPTTMLQKLPGYEMTRRLTVVPRRSTPEERCLALVWCNGRQHSAVGFLSCASDPSLEYVTYKSQIRLTVCHITERVPRPPVFAAKMPPVAAKDTVPT